MGKRKIVKLGEVQGKFEDKNFKIEIAPEGYNCQVSCNGKSLTNVRSAMIFMAGSSPTSVTIECQDS